VFTNKTVWSADVPPTHWAGNKWAEDFSSGRTIIISLCVYFDLYDKTVAKSSTESFSKTLLLFPISVSRR